MHDVSGRVHGHPLDALFAPRSVAVVGASRFRRLVRDYERLASTLTGYHGLAFSLLMLNSLFQKSPCQALGRPAPGTRKHFALVQITELAADPKRLARATDTVRLHWRGENCRRNATMSGSAPRS